MNRMRKIGNSDLETPPLILGGSVFGWTIDEATSFSVLDAFVGGGGRMIDTADVYSAWADGHKGGESEAIIGKWLKQRGRRDEVVITTKVGMLPGKDGGGLEPERIAAAIDESLARLQTDYVDLYLAHRDDESQELSAVAEAFGTLIKAGKVRFIGASNFSLDRFTAAIAAQENSRNPQYVALQNKYNLMERQDYEGALQRYCVEHAIGMTPYSGLASGYLTGKYRDPTNLRSDARADILKRYMEGNGPRVLAALDEVAESHGATSAQVALSWITAQSGIAAPIASATSVSQVEDLLSSMRLALSPEELGRLDESSAVS